MQAWGISLIALGSLSFLLPLLGRQFILVSLVGFTGVGSVFAGLILIGIGGLMLYISKKQEEAALPSPSATASAQIMRAKPQDVAETSNGSASTSQSNASTEMSDGKFPPNVIGNLIARTLDTSCSIDKISQEERVLLEKAKISLARYRDEILILAGFSQDYAIHQLLQHSPLRDEVLRGYRDAWANLGKHSGAGRARYDRFLERCPAYAAAAANLEVGTISPIALTFGKYLDADNNDAQMLALSFADSVFFSHFEGVKYTLEKGKILSASAGCDT